MYMKVILLGQFEFQGTDGGSVAESQVLIPRHLPRFQLGLHLAESHTVDDRSPAWPIFPKPWTLDILVVYVHMVSCRIYIIKSMLGLLQFPVGP